MIEIRDKWCAFAKCIHASYREEYLDGATQFGWKSGHFAGNTTEALKDSIFSNSSQGNYTYFGLPWGSCLKGLRRWVKAETFVRGWTIGWLKIITS